MRSNNIQDRNDIQTWQSNFIGHVGRFLHSSVTVAEMEARKIRHDSTELWTRVVQPALWLLIFGTTFNSIRALQIGGNIS